MMGHKKLNLLPKVSLFLLHNPSQRQANSYESENLLLSKSSFQNEGESFLMMTDEERSHNITDDESFYSRSYWETYESREFKKNTKPQRKAK